MMFARVARASIDPIRVDSVVREWEERALPVARQQPGFRQGYCLYDPSAHEALSIILFATRDDLEAAWPRIQLAVQALAGSVTGSVSFGSYEVRVDVS